MLQNRSPRSNKPLPAHLLHLPLIFPSDKAHFQLQRGLGWHDSKGINTVDVLPRGIDNFIRFWKDMPHMKGL